MVRQPDFNHQNFFFTNTYFPRWVPNIHLVEVKPNRRFCYVLMSHAGTQRNVPISRTPSLPLNSNIIYGRSVMIQNLNLYKKMHHIEGKTLSNDKFFHNHFFAPECAILTNLSSSIYIYNLKRVSTKLVCKRLSKPVYCIFSSIRSSLLKKKVKLIQTPMWT